MTYSFESKPVAVPLTALLASVLLSGCNLDGSWIVDDVDDPGAHSHDSGEPPHYTKGAEFDLVLDGDDIKFVSKSSDGFWPQKAWESIEFSQPDDARKKLLNDLIRKHFDNPNYYDVCDGRCIAGDLHPENSDVHIVVISEDQGECGYKRCVDLVVFCADGDCESGLESMDLGVLEMDQDLHMGSGHAHDTD